MYHQGELPFPQPLRASRQPFGPEPNFTGKRSLDQCTDSRNEAPHARGANHVRPKREICCSSWWLANVTFAAAPSLNGFPLQKSLASPPTVRHPEYAAAHGSIEGGGTCGARLFWVVSMLLGADVRIQKLTVLRVPEAGQVN